MASSLIRTLVAMFDIAESYHAFWRRFLLLLAVAAGSHAQVFDATHAGVPVQIPAGAGWRFHDEAPGEDGVAKGWAAAGFDDSAWATGDDRVPNGEFVRWYRLRVRLPREQTAAIYVDRLPDAFEVYADGKRIGRAGKFHPNRWLSGFWAWSGTLPRQKDNVQIALRAYLPTEGLDSVVSKADIRIGDPELLHALSIGRSQLRNGRMVTGCLRILTAGGIGILLLALWFQRRGFRANLWLGSSLIINAFISGMVFASMADVSPEWLFTLSSGFLSQLVLYLPGLLEIEFVYAWFGRPVDRWARVVQAITVALAFTFGFLPEWVFPFFILINAAIWLGLVIVLGARGHGEAWILTPPALLRFGFRFLYANGWLGFIDAGVIAFNLDDVATLLYFVTIGFVVIRRFFLVSKEGDRIAGELAAAQEAQSSLVPAAPVDPPGYRLEVAYLAASEVGGDFYQVFPLSGDRCVVVIGDVSGKGLKAAMTGMLLMGALRTVEMETTGPAAVLAAMNRGLCSAKGASGSTEFATCLCVVLNGSGGCVLANAGHLSPYSGGVEVPGPSDLPLGITTDVEYEEFAFSLCADGVLTMVTDGVLEATNSQGEMLGFDRLPSLSGKAAGEIAEAARAWGQNDDITVVKVACAC